MSFKSFLISHAAKIIAESVNKWKITAIDDQNRLLLNLINKAKNSVYGVNYNFKDINDYESFKRYVPIMDYESMRPYVDRIIDGQKDILWPGIPKYLAKTSGTTSGVKYIPVTKESIAHQVQSARNAMFNYFYEKGEASVFKGKVIFLSGSPVLTTKGKIKTGRLSGIVNHEVPSWVRTNQLPAYDTNCIDDWEGKLDRIVDETFDQDMRLISGIPPWVQMYYEKLLEKTGKRTILEIFPNYSLFMYGGVNFEPYRAKLEELVGGSIDSIETFPASEGFFAFQDKIDNKGLLLNTKAGIFFEFVPLEEIEKPEPTRLSLQEVELNQDYAVIISTNAGLWAYNLGDCVRFVSLNPFKILVTGRVKHFISAFGEHVIGKEVETALDKVIVQQNVSVVEFTVAPQVNPIEESLPYHEWFIEFGELPRDINEFSNLLDAEMRRQNIYYDDLIKGKVLRPLIIRQVHKGTFREYMKSQGKLGGQNKVPRLSNNRLIADGLSQFFIIS